MKTCRDLLLSAVGLLCDADLAAAMQVGAAHPWQTTFQEAASPMMIGITVMHQHLMLVACVIAALVGILLFYTAFRFRSKRNPIASKTTHHVWLEVIWTLIPALIVTVIAIPSLKLLYKAERIPPADITLKVIGNQWYWSYEYPDHNIAFDSYMLEDHQLKPGDRRLLEVDQRVFVPVGTTVKVLITARDVLHSFAVPALGLKKDAVPGRLNESWFHIFKEGVYYGQCSELCGAKHGFMPIVIEAVSKERYNQWLKEKGGHLAVHSEKPSGKTPIPHNEKHQKKV